jgi:hypothetical protein
MSTSPLTPPRHRGGQFGNQNAYKHGFYKPRPDVISRFDTDMNGGVSAEMDALRDLVDSALNIYAAIEKPTLEQCLATLRGVSQAFDTMRGLCMTQKVLFHNHTSIEDALDELAVLPVEQD